MPAQLLNGKALALHIRSELKEEIKRLGTTPGLAVLLIGDDPASHMYVRLKEKAAAEVGIHFEKILLPQNIEEELVLAKIDTLNRRQDIHGIVVQLPLPPHLHEDRVTQEIFPEKDADGFHPKNIELLMAGPVRGREGSQRTSTSNGAGTPRVVPNVMQGILRLIDATGVSPSGKRAAILANSDVFATPLAKLLVDRGVVADYRLQIRDYSIVKKADILIVALGKPHAITNDMIKDGAMIIDVGTTRVDGKILGDVHPNVSEKAGWLTPVPGGVGPLTVAYLLKNVVALTKKTSR